MGKIGNNFRMFLWMTLLTGILYPLLITGIAQLTMKEKANGGLILIKDQIVGAELIGQKFETEKYFWGRPSAVDYNPMPSGGSNLGPTSAALKKIIGERKAKIAQFQTHSQDIPPELLFASGSGIDPHIELSTAYFQIERIAKSRNMNEKTIKELVDKMTIKPFLYFLAKPYVNVLMLNKALDEISAS